MNLRRVRWCTDPYLTSDKEVSVTESETSGAPKSAEDEAGSSDRLAQHEAAHPPAEEAEVTAPEPEPAPESEPEGEDEGDSNDDAKDEG